MAICNFIVGLCRNLRGFTVCFQTFNIYCCEIILYVHKNWQLTFCLLNMHVENLTLTALLKYIHSEAEKMNEALNDQIEELNRTLKVNEKKTEEILQEKENVMKELDERQTLIQKNERDCVALKKLLEINAEKELAVLSDRLETRATWKE